MQDFLRCFVYQSEFHQRNTITKISVYLLSLSLSLSHLLSGTVVQESSLESASLESVVQAVRKVRLEAVTQELTLQAIGGISSSRKPQAFHLVGSGSTRLSRIISFT